jgi:two-component system response regulator FixJ
MSQKRDIILIVDDDKAVRDSLKFSLEVEGLDVRVFAEGKELLASPALTVARCILIDYKMPVMDGFAVLRALSAKKVSTPVILITVHATESIRRQAKAAGVSHVLEKPFFNGSLLETIHDVIGSTCT